MCQKAGEITWVSRADGSTTRMKKHLLDAHKYLAIPVSQLIWTRTRLNPGGYPSNHQRDRIGKYSVLKLINKSPESESSMHAHILKRIHYSKVSVGLRT